MPRGSEQDTENGARSLLSGERHFEKLLTPVCPRTPFQRIQPIDYTEYQHGREVLQRSKNFKAGPPRFEASVQCGQIVVSDVQGVLRDVELQQLMDQTVY